MEIYKNNLEYDKKNGEREQYLQNLECVINVGHLYVILLP